MEASMRDPWPTAMAAAGKERSSWMPPARSRKRHLQADGSRTSIAHAAPRRGWIARAETALFAATLAMLAGVWLGALLAEAALGV